MINHRGPEFAAMLGRILEGMKPYFGTTSDIAMITTAGTGGLEAAVVNTLSPGDRVLGVSIGSFGDRFAKIARTYGAEVTKVDVEWGQAADPAVVREALGGSGDWKAVLLTHNETSTAVMNPIPELAAAVRELAPEALILVDSVSGLGAVPFEMDAWGIDVVVTGSQKAWMAAPGLAMIAASERAWAAMETATMPRFYLDLRAHRESHAIGTDAVHARHRRRLPGRRGAPPDDRRGRRGRLRAPRGVCRRRAGRARARSASSSSPTSVTRRERSRPRSCRTTSTGSRSTARSSGAASSWPVARASSTGKIFRLGHLGSVTLEEILGAMSVLEIASIGAGRPVRPGAAVAAAQVAALESLGVVTASAAGAGA